MISRSERLCVTWCSAFICAVLLIAGAYARDWGALLLAVIAAWCSDVWRTS